MCWLDIHTTCTALDDQTVLFVILQRTGEAGGTEKTWGERSTIKDGLKHSIHVRFS